MPYLGPRFLQERNGRVVSHRTCLNSTLGIHFSNSARDKTDVNGHTYGQYLYSLSWGFYLVMETDQEDFGGGGGMTRCQKGKQGGLVVTNMVWEGRDYRKFTANEGDHESVAEPYWTYRDQECFKSPSDCFNTRRVCIKTKKKKPVKQRQEVPIPVWPKCLKPLLVLYYPVIKQMRT